MKVAISVGASSTAAPPSTAAPAVSRRARGSIDLAFVEGRRIVIVDYKTDSGLVPGEHDLQIAAYKRAASEIFGLPAEAWVFYLYGGGKAFIVDAEGSAPRLEDAPDPEPTLPRGFAYPST
jgi:ATP-dependent exoDNAse (exonuclease V) beta subunit